MACVIAIWIIFSPPVLGTVGAFYCRLAYFFSTCVKEYTRNFLGDHSRQLQPFKEADAEMTVLSSTSEEENIDEPEEVVITDENNDEPEELAIPDENFDKPEELVTLDIE
ncbi:hypothetical protein AVEN_49651-1 [Araneus ventricosus]|uniref:Uncharacterized protein n=1 Tax=Araneus ventricosus TaxID=182803 RepID=A0A4Y2B7X9_ARAVE|nr:hypothetical protein AVEN_49651-1 [Araneus ventricosus]